MQTRSFGKTSKNEEATLYCFENRNGMKMEVTDFGATLASLYVPDEKGDLFDVVLGYDDAGKYDSGSGTYFGATVGRCANRTRNANFVLKGKTFYLNANSGKHNLHSGPDSYSFRIWKVMTIESNSITFALHSPDGDQGYPGAIDVAVTYRLTDDNALEIEYLVTSDQDTPVNLTNHSYFNLNGHDAGNILKHRMWIAADYYTETDEDSVTTGRLIEVENTPMDFRSMKEIGCEIEANTQALKWAGGYDHNWCVDCFKYDEENIIRKVAKLEADQNDIKMEVFTDMPGVQVYTANALETERGKRGTVYGKRQAVCFETQYYPNAMNCVSFKSPVCKAGETWKSKTIYQFQCNNNC